MVPINFLQNLSKLYKVSINYFFENITDLTDEDAFELFNYAFKVANNIKNTYLLILIFILKN